MIRYLSMLVAAAFFTTVLIIGCSTNQVSTSYKVEGSTDVAVRAAMQRAGMFTLA